MSDLADETLKLRLENQKLRNAVHLWGRRQNASTRRVAKLTVALNGLIVEVRALTTDDPDEQTEYTLPLYSQMTEALKMLREVQAELTPEEQFDGRS